MSEGGKLTGILLCPCGNTEPTGTIKHENRSTYQDSRYFSVEDKPQTLCNCWRHESITEEPMKNSETNSQLLNCETFKIDPPHKQDDDLKLKSLLLTPKGPKSKTGTRTSSLKLEKGVAVNPPAKKSRPHNRNRRSSGASKPATLNPLPRKNLRKSAGTQRATTRRGKRDPKPTPNAKNRTHSVPNSSKRRKLKDSDSKPKRKSGSSESGRSVQRKPSTSTISESLVKIRSHNERITLMEMARRVNKLSSYVVCFQKLTGASNLDSSCDPPHQRTEDLARALNIPLNIDGTRKETRLTSNQRKGLSSLSLNGPNDGGSNSKQCSKSSSSDSDSDYTEISDQNSSDSEINLQGWNPDFAMSMWRSKPPENIKNENGEKEDTSADILNKLSIALKTFQNVFNTQSTQSIVHNT